MSEALVAPSMVPAVLTRGPVAAALTHVAIAVPETRVTSAEIAARFDVGAEWIVSRTGIEERRVIGPDGTLAGLASEAAGAVLTRAEVDPLDVDLVLVATTTADHVTPNAAPLVAHAIGATRAGTIDVGAACTAFVSGIALGAAQIEAGRAETVLLVGADILTRYTDATDRKTAALFGDGAGAALMTAVSPGAGSVGPVVLGADGGSLDLLFASRERAVVEMDGQAVFKHAIARMSQSTLEACARAGVGLADIDLFVYHQANGRILRAVGERLGLTPERVVDCIGVYGNTSAASIPIAFEVARADGRLKDGARVLISAFGAGFTWGAVVVEWGSTA